MKKRWCFSKGQASTEYLMVAAIAMVVIFPIIFFFSDKASESIVVVVDSQITDIGNSIVDNSEIVYYQGVPARVTIERTFPDGIANITILGDQELVFTLYPRKELVFVSAIPIRGDFGDLQHSPGRKRIRLTADNDAGDDYVNISIY